MWKSRICGFFIVIAFCIFPAVSNARDINPIVSTDWLQQNLRNPKLIILDIRAVEEYRKGHIPGAVNAFYGTWASSKEGKRMEVPFEDDLFESIGAAGIRPDSITVVVCKMMDCYSQVQAARIACTLDYAGIENFSILDGGYEKWEREKKPVSKKIVEPEKTVYKGTVKRDLLVDMKYVKDRLGKAILVDVREPFLFSGEKKQAFVERKGHLPGSINLPASEAYTKSGAFKAKNVLESIVEKKLGSDKSKEIITYCDTGKCCPTWAFVLKNVLEYRNVRLYDGGVEEWSKDVDLPLTK